MTNVLENPPLQERPARSVVRTYAAGERLWDQGEPATGCAVIAEGTAEVLRSGRPAGRVEPGGYLGIAAVMARRPHRTAVVAATPLTVWWLDGDAVDHLVLETPAFAHDLVRRLARATVATNF